MKTVFEHKLEDGQLDVAYHLDFCPNCWKETAQAELPDKISMEEMYGYGYTWEGMLPSM